MLPKQKQIALRQIRGLQKLINLHTGGPSVLVKNILYLWQKESYPNLARSASLRGKVVRQTAAVAEFAAWLSQQDFLDAAFWLSSAYAVWVGDKVRIDRAMFFTPPELTERLIHDLVRHGASMERHVWMDPACGGAAFLAPVAQKMAQALRAKRHSSSAILDHIAGHLVGNDIDETLGYLSAQFLRMALYQEITEAGYEPKFRIGHANALLGLPQFQEQVDVVMCNPPYRKMQGAELAGLSEGLCGLMNGQPNLYGIFMVVCAQLLRKQGISGLITPMSFLSGKSFAPLRSFLGKGWSIPCVSIVEERGGIFLGVQQNTVITLLQPRKKKMAGSQVFYGSSVDGWQKASSVTLSDVGEPWVLPRRHADEGLLSQFGNHLTIFDYGYHPRTGNVVLHRDKRKRFATITDARKSHAVRPVPMIRAHEIHADGHLVFQKRKRRDCFIDVGQVGSGVVSLPAIALQRVTSTDQPRRLVCAIVPPALYTTFGGVLGENHVIFLVAEGDTQVTPDLLVRILSSETVDRLFRCISGVTNVSAYELKRLPLPHPEKVAAQLALGTDIETAVRFGYGMKVAT